MRRLEQDDRQGAIERLDRLAPRAAGRGQEAGEAIAGRGEARRGEGGRRGARPRDRADAHTGAVRLGHEQGAWIGDARRAGVAHQGDALAVAQRGDQALRRGTLVVLMHRHGACRHAVMPEQGARGTGVLAGDQGHRAQDLDGARTRIREVADGGSHDVQRSAVNPAVVHAVKPT